MEGVQVGNNVAESLSEVGIAFFGLGRIGTIHLNNLRKNPRAEILYCIEDLDERVNFVKNKWKLDTTFVKPADHDKVFKDKRSLSEEVYRDLPEIPATMETEGYWTKLRNYLAKMLPKARVDAVIICTPTFAHEELILKALKAGKAVFCEKPVAVSEEGIERCLKAVKKYKKPLLCGFNRRFDPGLRTVKERASSGEIGKVQIIKTCSRDSPRSPVQNLSISGGIFHDCAVHDIDLICWIVGEYPESVSAYAHANFEDVKESGDYDTVAITMKFPSGVLGIIDLSRYAAFGYDQRIEVFGSKGMLTNGEQRPVGVKCHNEKGTTAVPIYFSFESRYPESYAAEMEHFLNICQGLEECEVKPESILSISKIASALGEVVNSGRSCSLNLN